MAITLNIIGSFLPCFCLRHKEGACEEFSSIDFYFDRNAVCVYFDRSALIEGYLQKKKKVIPRLLLEFQVCQHRTNQHT